MLEKLTKEDWVNAEKSLDFWKDEWDVEVIGGWASENSGKPTRNVTLEDCKTRG